MKFFTKEVKIALVAIVGIVILFVGMQFLKGLSLFSSNNTYYVKFDNVSGLSVSSPIYANGYKVGVVERIDYDYANPNQIVAAIGLDKKLSLPRGTRAEISSDLLGNVKLELVFGDNPSDKLSVGDTIMGGMQQGVMSQAAAMVPQVQQLLPHLDSILVHVDTLLTDPSLQNTLHNTDQLTASLTETARDLHQLTAALNQQLPGMMNKASGVLDNTRHLTAKLDSLDIEQSLQRVNQILANVQQLTATLNSDQGTLGLLMRDPELYQNLNATMHDLDALLTDFKEHPKRYINVSVFGKKSD